MQSVKYFILLFILSSPVALADEVQGIYFEHNDWEIACDNTRTCRAAGYQSEGDSSGEEPQPVSVLLTRQAGPNAPVRGEVKIGGDEVPERKGAAAALVLRIDGKSLGKASYHENESVDVLSARQVQALLAALKRTSRIEFVLGSHVYRLSGAGAAAVLLKMDDFQGRVGTPGALVRKGSKAESSVLPPVPAPQQAIPRLDPLQPGDKALGQDKSGALHRALRQTLKGSDDCDEFNDKSELAVSRLSGGKLLVSTDCWMAAYNVGSGYWVIDERAPFHPVLVTVLANGDAKGIITSMQKGRGLGDCIAFDAWSWNGSRFVHDDALTTGLCKGFAMGAWDLPTIVNRSGTAWSR